VIYHLFLLFCQRKLVHQRDAIVTRSFFTLDLLHQGHFLAQALLCLGTVFGANVFACLFIQSTTAKKYNFKWLNSVLYSIATVRPPCYRMLKVYEIGFETFNQFLQPKVKTWFNTFSLAMYHLCTYIHRILLVKFFIASCNFLANFVRSIVRKFD